MIGEEGQEIQDPERLAELASLPLAAAETRRALDAITHKTAAELGLPISLVSLVLDGAQFFPGATGLQGWLAETRGTPVEWAFCRNVVEGSDPYRIEDARQDPRVKDNPLVTQDGIGCYLGVPLLTSKGNRLGSLCVIGGEPRVFSEADVARLRELAREAVEILERPA